MTSSDYIMILAINNSAQAVLLQVTGLVVSPLQTTQCEVVRRSVRLFVCVAVKGMLIDKGNGHGLKSVAESKTSMYKNGKVFICLKVFNICVTTMCLRLRLH